MMRIMRKESSITTLAKDTIDNKDTKKVVTEATSPQPKYTDSDIELLSTDLKNLMKAINEDDEAPKLDGNLDDLLKNDDGADKDAGAGSPDDLDKLPDLTNDDDTGKEEEGAPDDLKNLDDKDKEGGADDTNTKYETDTNGLVDAITKLAKSGHSVKIVVTAESNDPMKSIFNIDGKDYSYKEAKALIEAEESDTVNKNKDDVVNSTLVENLGALTDAVSKLTAKLSDPAPTQKGEPDAAPVTESTSTFKTPKILKESDNIVMLNKEDYERFINETSELQFKATKAEVDKFAFDNKLLETNQNDAITTEEDLLFSEGMSNAFNDIDKQMDALNESVTQMANINRASRFVDGGLSALAIFNETIVPYLNEINEYKSAALSTIATDRITMEAVKSITEGINYKNKYDTLLTEVNSGAANSIIDYDKLLTEGINDLNNMNRMDLYSSLLETLIDNTDGDTVLKEDIISLLNEANDISAMDASKGYDSNYPTYEIFSKGVMARMKKIDMNSSKSNIADIHNDDKLIKPSDIDKTQLPVLQPEKYNANITIKSAISNLMENLIDVDGNVNIDLCEQAYLYKKVNKPQSIKDFAMPIAIVEGTGSDKHLVAHPKLIENVAHILKNESCMRVYDIASRNDLYALRESLMPYLEAIKMEAPWKKTTTKKNTTNTTAVISEETTPTTTTDTE